MKICTWKGVCAFTLGILGIPVISCHADRNGRLRSIKVEGFTLQDTGGTVYGGPDSYITASLYGKVTNAATGEALAGIKVEVYDGTNCEGTVYTDESGTFFIDQNSFWAGVEGMYNMIVSDPAKQFAPVKQVLLFEIGEVSKEVNVAMELKK